jgi:hypothetical protein
MTSPFGNIHRPKDRDTQLAIDALARIIQDRLLSTKNLGGSFTEGDLTVIERYFRGQRESRRQVVRQSEGDGAAVEIHSNGQSMLSMDSDAGFGSADYVTTDLGAKLTSAGVWTDAPCTYEKKVAIRRIENAEIVDRIRQLPVFEFEHRKELGVKRIGPTVEDLWHAFRVGYPTSISARDLAGIAIRAVQCALEKIDDLEARIAKLEKNDVTYQPGT